MPRWNPWHGCHKISEGCKNCYVYRIDARYDRDSSVVVKTGDFGLPIRRSRDGSYRIPSGETLYTCFTSDFFVEDADAWRSEAWAMMRVRSDVHFLLVTKRITRFRACIPEDWGDGYENVTIICTVENQARADERLPVFLAAPIRHKGITCEPLLEAMDIEPYLTSNIEEVVVGGESGPQARTCFYDWILSIRDQCVRAGVPFHFKQTGARFDKDGVLYRVPRRHQHQQAAKAGIDYHP